MNFSINELLESLQKTGAVFDDSFTMKQQQPFLGEALRNTADTSGIEGARQRYRQSIDQIAQMDQKLGGLYGDPNSNLFIEHAGQRDAARGGAMDVGYKVAGDEAQNVENEQKLAETKLDEAMALYQDLTTQQDQEETENERLVRESEKEGRTVSGGKGEATVEITPSQKRAYTEAGLDFTNARIRARWNGSPGAFQKWFTQQRVDGKIGDQEITPRELDYWLTQWTKQEEKKAQAKKDKNKTTTDRKSLF